MYLISNCRHTRSIEVRMKAYHCAALWNGHQQTWTQLLLFLIPDKTWSQMSSYWET